MASLAGEIPIKSPRTRPRFEERLVRNVLKALKRNGFIGSKVWISGARLFVEASEGAERVIARVFGIHRVAKIRCLFEFDDLDELCRRVEECAREWVKGKKFALRVHRVGKHDFTSLDVAREAGAFLRKYSAGVDLENPEVEVFVEVRGRRVYIYTNHDVVEGPGGLPLGVEGRALVLFSGSTDSTVAAWLIAKRGVEVDMLHLIFMDKRSVDVALTIGRKLAREWLYGYSPKMYVVDLRDLVERARKLVGNSYLQPMLRVFMYIAASSIAANRGYDTIITGESLGQTPSQTLHDLRVVENLSSPAVPVIRPLIGLDKEDSVRLSRKLGLYELSSKTTEFSADVEGRTVTRIEETVLAEVLRRLNAREEISRRCLNPKIYELV